ncbi:helix-turn-helix transcriptional regulator [uncultured Alistipes sp.]|uniref:helix-turn-helix domain-containing protein n=1 Tax=uncultured Alistipes sp. TaxID=538949 RepID=UPI0025D1BCBC|nr:helix-turn-helix transcriptional regulator [uncultured Alistipes sp.]
MGLRVKELLKEKGVTTYQLAEHLGVTQPAVSSAMNGNPNMKWLESVAGFLNVPIGDLFDNHASNNTISCPHCGKAIRLEKVE